MTKEPVVFLNGRFIPASQASISPLDRGFLFGDGIYEVIPSYQGRLVALEPHLKRLYSGLNALSITLPDNPKQLAQHCRQLIQANSFENCSLYIHVSRGADINRNHIPTGNVQPTCFMMLQPIEAVSLSDISTEKPKGLSLASYTDLRWQHCDIKSTALLGNVLHLQKAVQEGFDECLLFNQHDELTEAATANVFIVSKNKVYTPQLDTQKLPGITRFLLIEMLAKYSDFQVIEGTITRQDVKSADEIWITSSTKGVRPVTRLDNQSVGAGVPGPVWVQVARIYFEHLFEY